MKLARALILVAFTSSPAWAGCANYEDGSTEGPAPRARICLGSKCEVAVVTFQCGNIHGAQYGYTKGWRVDIDDAGTTVRRKGKVVDVSKVKCVEFDEGACFPPARR